MNALKLMPIYVLLLCLFGKISLSFEETEQEGRVNLCSGDINKILDLLVFLISVTKANK